MPSLPDFLNLVEPLAQRSAVGLSVLFILVVLVFSDWRLIIAGFALLKVLAGILLTRLLPPEWALLQWLSGGIMGVMWFLSARRVDTIRRRQLGIPWWRPQWRLDMSTLMRMSLMLLLLIVAYTIRPLFPFPNLPSDLGRLSTFLALAALLGLGLGEQPLRWGVSLAMWLLAGHFVIFALQVNEDTVGLLASLDILLGFAISYLIIVDGARTWPHAEEA